MKKHILIAEDELFIIESLRFILERENYSVTEVHDGQAVVEMVRRCSPDLLILDLMLPRRNGFEILKSLKQQQEFRELPVLMLTAKGQQQDKLTAEQLGVDAFMTKPFSNKEVIACANRLIASEDSKQ